MSDRRNGTAADAASGAGCAQLGCPGSVALGSGSVALGGSVALRRSFFRRALVLAASGVTAGLRPGFIPAATPTQWGDEESAGHECLCARWRCLQRRVGRCMPASGELVLGTTYVLCVR